MSLIFNKFGSAQQINGLRTELRWFGYCIPLAWLPTDPSEPQINVHGIKISLSPMQQQVRSASKSQRKLPSRGSRFSTAYSRRTRITKQPGLLPACDNGCRGTVRIMQTTQRTDWLITWQTPARNIHSASYNLGKTQTLAISFTHNENKIRDIP